jgi:uncharacterized phage protein gp47/JayE
MIDLGKPFSEAYKDIIDALEDRVRHGVEQPARQRFPFEGAGTTYELPDTTYAVTRVTSLKEKKLHYFEPGKDYRFANSRIIWIAGGAKPDQGTRFEVEYTYRERPAGLTDFNPGSVVGTLVRTVARQMKLIYDQMDEAYRRAFIDEATGVALDNVVALLGVTRIPAQRAEGSVTFFLKRATDTPVGIPADTRVADESGRTFATQEDAEIPDLTDEYTTQSEGVIRTNNRIAQLEGVWRQGEDPESDPPLFPDPEEEPPDFGEDERTVTLPEGVRPEGPLLVRYRPKSATVPVAAVEQGPDGNVNAGTITIMPTPPPGVEGVVNDEPVTGGQLPEPDDRLRERAKHALERAGNATLNAIRFAVLEVDGVEGVEVVDHSVDDTVPLGEVRVRYSGGERAEVEEAVEGTRAAGILARLDEIERVLISGTFYLIPEPGAAPAAAGPFLAAVAEAVNALAIGAPLSVRRLNALAYNVPGLADVAEAQLEHDRGGETGQPVTDPLLIGPSELARPDETNLDAVLVSALRAPRTQDNEIDVQLVDAVENPLGWKSFSMDLAVTLRAYLENAPTQPPERIGSLTKTLDFEDASTATLVITAQDVDALEPGPTDSHRLTGVEVEVGSAVYPGVIAAEGATIDLPEGT